MSMIIISVGIVIFILVIFVLYAVYRGAIHERNGVGYSLTPDEEIGLHQAFKKEKEELEKVKTWCEETRKFYHFQLTSSEVLDTYLGDLTEEALKENLARAEGAVQEHKDRLGQLRTYAEEHNIDLGEEKVEDENNGEKEGDREAER